MNHDAAEQLVRRVARRYKARCWWCDSDDLLQVGREAVLNCARTFDPRVGVPEAGYVWRAVVLAMRRHLWKESSPVSGGERDPRTHRTGKRAALAEEHPADDEGVGGGVVLCDPAPSPEALVEEHRWSVRVLEKVAEQTAPEHELGLRVLLDGLSPRDVAEEASVPVREVYRSTYALQLQLLQPSLRALLLELEKEDS